MLFGSYTFLLLLGALVVLLPHARRPVWLVAAFSLVFYSALSPWYLALLVATSLVDFTAARAIEARRDRARAYLLLSLAANLGVLFFFKYAEFAATIANDLARVFGVDLGWHAHDLPLPIGISFYTFQSIAYVVDVYRGTMPAIRRLDGYILFVSFFPQILAGPIERAQHLYPQIERIGARPGAWAAAAPLLLAGFAKKFLVADNIAPFVDRVFEAPAEASLATLVFATFCFGIQIYCDFSGYTDLARGLARGMGVELVRNFDRPYSAASVTDFWRRWHMSLSGWLRDYVYIPLGGSRGGLVATCRNLFATMLLAGLWHGASYCFLVWGALHGGVLVVERVVREKFPRFSMPLPLARMLTLLFVFCGWFVFRVTDSRDLLLPLEKLFVADTGQLMVPTGAAIFGLSLYFGAILLRRLRTSPANAWLEGVTVVLLAYVFMPVAYQKFIYFQF
jgi:alginate O-acetyltransferase complex protein AlgI